MVPSTIARHEAETLSRLALLHRDRSGLRAVEHIRDVLESKSFSPAARGEKAVEVVGRDPAG